MSMNKDTSPPQVFDLAPVAERLRLVREHVGLSQQAFGDRLGFSRRQIIAWETAANSPPIALLVAIRTELDVDPEWVLMGPGQKPLRDVGAKEQERRERVQGEVETLVKNAGLELSQRAVTNLVNLILREEPEDEKTARQKMFKTLRALSMSLN